MTLAEIIRSALDTAIAGTDPDTNVIQKLRQEAEVLAEQAIHHLATDVAADPERRGLLERATSITLTSGVGSLESVSANYDILTEYLLEGAVVDADTGASNGVGNVLVRIKNYADFLKPLPTVFGYYCISTGNQIYTKQVASGSTTDTIGPLTVTAPVVPTLAGIATYLPHTLEDEMIKYLALRIRGYMDNVIPNAIK